MNWRFHQGIRLPRISRFDGKLGGLYGFSALTMLAALLRFRCPLVEIFAEKTIQTNDQAETRFMAKPTHKVKKANHGKRPANNRGRKAKKKRIKTP